MSEPNFTERAGMIPIEIITQAKLIDRARTLRAEVDQIADQIEVGIGVITEYMQEQFETKRNALAEQNLDHDEFLRQYQQILLSLPQRSTEVKEFHEELNIRSQLTPGTYIGIGETIVTVADPTDGIDPNVGIRPVIHAYPGDRAGRKHFAWSVPIAERPEPILVHSGLEIGKKVIKAGLDEHYFGRYSTKNKIGLSDYVQGVGQYEKIQDQESADELRETALFDVNKFVEKAFGQWHLSDSDEINFDDNLHTFKLLSLEKYEKFLEFVKKKAVEGDYTNAVMQVVAFVAWVEKQNVEEGEEYASPTALEIAKLYTSFVEEGNTLLQAELEVEA